MKKLWAMECEDQENNYRNAALKQGSEK